jgi:hypothetical protein
VIERIRLACTTIAIAAVLATRPFAGPTLPHLRGIEEIRGWFNAEKGKVRLILLLSPT